MMFALGNIMCSAALLSGLTLALLCTLLGVLAVVFCVLLGMLLMKISAERKTLNRYVYIRETELKTYDCDNNANVRISVTDNKIKPMIAKENCDTKE